MYDLTGRKQPPNNSDALQAVKEPASHRKNDVIAACQLMGKS